MCWFSGMVYSPMRRASCPSRLLNLVCKILTPSVSMLEHLQRQCRGEYARYTCRSVTGPTGEQGEKSTPPIPPAVWGELFGAKSFGVVFRKEPPPLAVWRLRCQFEATAAQEIPSTTSR